jgi:RHS repeat-associated protein
VVWRAYYKAWGGLEALSPNLVEQNLRFQGQYHDRESGLYYNTFRYYDPAVGRFTTQDPIGLMGGDNLYQYAPNPNSWIDPLGWCNGNARTSTKAQHGYEIVDTTSAGSVVKTGVSGGRIRLDGKSARAETQVRKWNSEPGNANRYESRTVKHEPAGVGARENILKWEAQNANLHRSTLDPLRHHRP